jgi:acyl carrier protein
MEETMTDNDDVRAIVERVVAAEAHRALPLPGQARLAEDLGLSSLAVIQLLVRLEEELKSELDEATVVGGGVSTVTDLVQAFQADHRPSSG